MGIRRNVKKEVNKRVAGRKMGYIKKRRRKQKMENESEKLTK